MDFDARIVQIVVVATLILIVAFNNRFVEAEYDRFVLEFLIPIAIIVLAWRENPRSYGLRLGDWRLGLVVIVTGSRSWPLSSGCSAAGPIFTSTTPRQSTAVRPGA